MTDKTESTNKSKTPLLVAIIVAALAIGGYVSTTMLGGDKATSTDVASSTATDAGTAPSTSDVTIAEVNGNEIKLSEAKKFIENVPQLHGQPLGAIFPMVQEQLVSSKIVSDLADGAGIENDPEVAKRLEMAKTEIIRTVFIEKELAKKVTDAKLKGAYKEFLTKQPEVEEARARHILVEKEDEAKAIIKQLNDGGDFVALAKEKSTGPTGENGGDLGYFTAKDMVPEFSTAAFGLEKGAVTSTPVKTQFGFHVIKLEDKRMRPSPSYEEVKPYLESQERKTALNDLLNGWKEEAKISVFDIDGNAIEPASGE